MSALTRRDYFTAKFMQAFIFKLSVGEVVHQEYDMDKLMTLAVEQADLLIQKLEEKKNPPTQIKLK